MECTKYLLKLTFTTAVLGGQPGRDDPASKFIRDKTREEHPEVDIPEEEINSLPEEIAKGTTGFFRDANGNPIMKSYQIKGMIKAAGMKLNGLDGLKNLRSKVQDCIFINPIELPILNASTISIEERPLMANTLQGPRVSLARSERIEASATVECELESVKLPKFAFTEEKIRNILDYGMKIGMLQWRNSNMFGQFTYELTLKQ